MRVELLGLRGRHFRATSWPVPGSRAVSRPVNEFTPGSEAAAKGGAIHTLTNRWFRCDTQIFKGAHKPRRAPRLGEDPDRGGRGALLAGRHLRAIARGRPGGRYLSPDMECRLQEC